MTITHEQILDRITLREMDFRDVIEDPEEAAKQKANCKCVAVFVDETFIMSFAMLSNASMLMMAKLMGEEIPGLGDIIMCYRHCANSVAAVNGLPAVPIDALQKRINPRLAQIMSGSEKPPEKPSKADLDALPEPLRSILKGMINAEDGPDISVSIVGLPN